MGGPVPRSTLGGTGRDGAGDAGEAASSVSMFAEAVRRLALLYSALVYCESTRTVVVLSSRGDWPDVVKVTRYSARSAPFS